MLAVHVLSCSCLCKVCSCDSQALMLVMHVLFCSCLCKVCSCDSEALMIAMHVLFCCLCKVCSCDSEALMLAMHVLFCSCLCKLCPCNSEALMLAMRVLFCSCLRNVSSTVSKALLRFTAFPNNLSALTHAFLFKVNTDHIHNKTCSRVPPCYTADIPFLDTYLCPYFSLSYTNKAL